MEGDADGSGKRGQGKEKPESIESREWSATKRDPTLALFFVAPLASPSLSLSFSLSPGRSPGE